MELDQCAHSYRNNGGCPECGVSLTGWDGTGSPPVGSEVEALLTGLGTSRFWQLAKVVHGPLPDSPNEILVFSLENTKPAWTDEFRPVRTPEQIAAEERDRAVEEMHEIITADNLKGFGITMQLKAIYDAGYRKQVTS